jgi:hypothetical protein
VTEQQPAGHQGGARSWGHGGWLSETGLREEESEALTSKHQGFAPATTSSCIRNASRLDIH